MSTLLVGSFQMLPFAYSAPPTIFSRCFQTVQVSQGGRSFKHLQTPFSVKASVKSNKEFRVKPTEIGFVLRSNQDHNLLQIAER
jgi:hypothetical protein